MKKIVAPPQSMLFFLNQFNGLSLINRMAVDFQASKNRFIFFDYDGTLSPIKPGCVNAEDPTTALKICLEKLSAVPNTAVYIISARPLPKLLEWLSDYQGIGLAGDLGVMIRHPHQTKVLPLLPQAVQQKWNTHLPVIQNAFNQLLSDFPSAWISQGQFSMGLKPPTLPCDTNAWESRVASIHSQLTEQLPETDFRIQLYLKQELVIEPKTSEKQLAVNHILSRVSPEALKDSFVLFAGDGDSDESGFSAIRNYDTHFAYPIRVGSASSSTQALFLMKSPQTLLSFIDQVTSNQVTMVRH